MPEGCLVVLIRVIQKILKCATSSQAKSRIIDCLIPKAKPLAFHSSGNHAIQSILVYGTQEETTAIIEQLAPRLLPLSCDKYGSIVLERCITEGSLASRTFLIETSFDGPKRCPHICAMAQNRFGNYVARKIIEVSCITQFHQHTS